MKSKPVQFLLVDLGVDKTLTYRPELPERFASIQDTRSFCRGFLSWYNTLHRHSGIACLTPETVHHGHAANLIDARQVVLLEAYASHPERFVKAAPRPPELGEAVWINKPEPEAESEVVRQWIQKVGVSEPLTRSNWCPTR